MAAFPVSNETDQVWVKARSKTATAEVRFTTCPKHKGKENPKLFFLHTSAASRTRRPTRQGASPRRGPPRTPAIEKMMKKCSCVRQSLLRPYTSFRALGPVRDAKSVGNVVSQAPAAGPDPEQNESAPGRDGGASLRMRPSCPTNSSHTQRSAAPGHPVSHPPIPWTENCTPRAQRLVFTHVEFVQQRVGSVPLRMCGAVSTAFARRWSSFLAARASRAYAASLCGG